MTVTPISPTVSNSLGELSVTGDVWNATLTVEASNAISAMDWNGDYLEVTFRHKGNNSEPYSYSVRNGAQSVLLEEVRAVLTGKSADTDAPASIGTVYNQLLKTKDLVLVD